MLRFRSLPTRVALTQAVFRRGLQTKRHVKDDPEYHQRSVIPTFHFQKSIPRLPINKLDDSLNKYLDVVQPVLTPEEFAATKAVVEKFRTGEGPELHEKLISKDKANKHTSFISEPWYEMYLATRDPVAINVNPFLQLPLDEKLVASVPKERRQALRAARCTFSSVRFYRSLVDQNLAPDLFHTKPDKSKTDLFETLAKLVPQSISWYFAYLHGAYPLDMVQYEYLFGTNRVPKPQSDILDKYHDSKHITVGYRGQLFALPVFKPDGRTALSIPELEGLFQSIISDTPSTEHCIGTLTTEHRDTWAAERENLLKAGNEASLKQVESGLFFIGLDESTGETHTDLAYQFLCGARDRWYDKSFSLIITDTSDTCINFEHSWGDGVAVLRYTMDMTYDANLERKIEDPIAPTAAPEPLEWNITSEVAQGVANAAARLAKQTSELDFQTKQFSGFGKNLAKQKGLSPDGVAQMSFQLAFFLTHNEVPATYESASTSGFRHGRTETVRPCSMDSKAWVDAVVAGKDNSELFGLLKKAVDTHSAYVKDCLMGKGMDRHLFALKYHAKDKAELPEIFRDPAYAKINHIRVSTSTLNTDAIVLGGFGPVANDGYGIGYFVSDVDVNIGVSSYIGSSEFLANFEKACQIMGAILNAGPDAKK